MPGAVTMLSVMPCTSNALCSIGTPGLTRVSSSVLLVQASITAIWTVVHPPTEYDYSEGYFAVFVEDPDGTRWEFAHIPTPTH
jgi:hypothetical protein